MPTARRLVPANLAGTFPKTFAQLANLFRYPPVCGVLSSLPHPRRPPPSATSAPCPLTQQMAKSAIVRGRTSASQGVGLHERARVDEADGGGEGVAGQVRQDVWQG